MSLENKVYIVCNSETTVRAVAETLKRVAAAMSAMNTLCEFMADLPDDRPEDWADLAGPKRLIFWLTLFELYPEGPDQIAADIESIGTFKVHL